MQINAERLAYWYLRLNGFLTIPGFVVHPDRGRDQETDVDLIGIRLPYRAENLDRPMRDDPRWTCAGEKSHLAFVEVKAGGMRLNGPWTNRERNNMLRLLCAVGPFPDAEARLAAKSLYESGVYSNQLYQIALVCMGARVNEELMASHPHVPQITWQESLHFIYDRFRAYRHEKRSHGQWDADGQCLWRTADSVRTADGFVDAVHVTG